MTILSQLHLTLLKSPDKEAIFSGEESLTFQQLHTEAVAAARSLRRLGVQTGDRVGVCMQKSLDQVVAILGALYANAILVPIHYVLQPGQIAHIAEDCEMKLLITESRRITELREITTELTICGRGSTEETVISLAALRQEYRGSESFADRKPDDVAAIIYSSGSTGRPKGIVISHRNFADGARLVASYLGTDSTDRIAGVLGLTFDHGLNQLWQTVLTGASLYLHDLIFPRDLFRLLAEKRLTALPLMPVIISRMFDPQLSAPESGLDFSALRYISTTGGAVTKKMLRQLSRTFPSSEIVLMYGLTEAFRSSFLPPDQLRARPTSIGKAIPEVELYVLDEKGNDCPPGVPGQLVHRGGCVARGYWNAPEATAERFRQIDRFPGETVVFSGDLVQRDEQGYLYFLARMDSLIKTWGFRVSPTEIEEHARRCDQLLDAVAFGIDHSEVGQQIALAYTTDDRAPISSDLLEEHFRSALPHHMVPKWFIYFPSFPATASEGKVDRLLVRDLALAQLTTVSAGGNS